MRAGLVLAVTLALALVGCGGGKNVAPEPETVEGTVPTETGPAAGALPKGNAEAGKKVFTEEAVPACSTCHTFAAAGSTTEVGPNLDDALADKDADFILESIVDPDAEITEGFADNLMPEDYGEKLSKQQLADLVAFLLPKS
jgi:mono/diheme cytochrome c family protein